MGSAFRGEARNAAVALVWMGWWWCAARTAELIARSVILGAADSVKQGSLA